MTTARALLAALLLAGCTRSASPPPDAAPASPPSIDQGPAADGAALPPSEPAGRWFRAISDEAVVFVGPKAKQTYVRGYVSTGTLVESRTPDPRTGDIPPKKVELERAGRPRITFDGPILTAQFADEDLCWIYKSTIAPPPVDVPPRARLCEVLAAATPPVDAATCSKQSRFVLLDREGAAPRFLLALPGYNAAGSLHVIDLEAAGDGGAGPVAVSSVPTTGAAFVHQGVLPGGRVLVVLVDEIMPVGPDLPSGTGYAFAFVDGRGAITREPPRPQIASLPKGGKAAQSQLIVIFERTPAGPVVTVRGHEQVQDIATAKVLSMKPVALAYSWDARTNRWSARPAPRQAAK